MNAKPLHLQLFAALIGILAFGSSHWPPDYNSVGLPNSLFGLGIAAAILLAAALRLVPTIGLLRATTVIGVTAPIAVFARVLVETTLDPTSHNLWPFELIIAAMVGSPLAFAGALIGGLLAPWLRDEVDKRRQR